MVTILENGNPSYWAWVDLIFWYFMREVNVVHIEWVADLQFWMMLFAFYITQISSENDMNPIALLQL